MGRSVSREPSGQCILASEKGIQKKVTPVLIWILSCLGVTPGTAAAFWGPCRVPADGKGSMLWLVKQDIEKSFSPLALRRAIELASFGVWPPSRL